MGVPRFEPFAALRYSTDSTAGLDDLVAPPYDVLSEADIDGLAARHRHNVVHVDVPRERDGEGRYRAAGALFRQWIASGVLVADRSPTFTIYRMRFTDAAGRRRDIAGVVGALEVVDEGAGGVLPHERVTPKASTDRLDLTRATNANLSPIWGLSLRSGLSELLAQPGEPLGTVTVDGVEHVVERVSDPARIDAIAAAVGADDVLIADGHHRYGVARNFRDETRAAPGTDLTLAFVSELVADQLSVEAIHRIYRGIDREALIAALSSGFELVPAGRVGPGTLSEMERRRALCLVDRDGEGLWLTPRPGALDDVRALDGLWLERMLDGANVEVAYQHGVAEVLTLLADDPTVTAAVLIRPVSVAEIERTAREGMLMPPKSTFFTPKLRTGLVIRAVS